MSDMVDATTAGVSVPSAAVAATARPSNEDIDAQFVSAANGTAATFPGAAASAAAPAAPSMAAAAAESYAGAASGSNGSASMWAPWSSLDALSADLSHSGGASPTVKQTTGKRKAPAPDSPPKMEDVYTEAEGKWDAAQLAAAAAATPAAAAAAPRVGKDVKPVKPTLFAELDSGRRSSKMYTEAPFILTELPTDWFVNPPDDALECCVCTNVVFDPPNLEVCGQSN
jgi:hypothetical protein